MAVSDLYVVQYLIQAMEETPPGIEWREGPSSELRAEHHGVHLCLFSAHSTSGARRCLRISHAGKKTYIEEPHNSAVFGRRYRDEEESRLAAALRQLAELAGAQSSRRNEDEWNLRVSIRESLYDRLLFGR